MSTDQNTGTADVTREVRTGPTQDVTRTSSKDHIGGDVAMRRDSADDDSAGHPSLSEQTGEEPQRKGNHVKSAMRKRASPSTTFQEESRKKRSCRSTQLQLPHERHWTEPRENNEGRERREQCITLGVNFISRSCRHDALRLRREFGT